MIAKEEDQEGGAVSQEALGVEQVKVEACCTQTGTVCLHECKQFPDTAVPGICGAKAPKGGNWVCSRKAGHTGLHSGCYHSLNRIDGHDVVVWH